MHVCMYAYTCIHMYMYLSWDCTVNDLLHSITLLCVAGAYKSDVGRSQWPDWEASCAR